MNYYKILNHYSPPFSDGACCLIDTFRLKKEWICERWVQIDIKQIWFNYSGVRFSVFSVGFRQKRGNDFFGFFGLLQTKKGVHVLMEELKVQKMTKLTRPLCACVRGGEIEVKITCFNLHHCRCRRGELKNNRYLIILPNNKLNQAIRPRYVQFAA